MRVLVGPFYSSDILSGPLAGPIRGPMLQSASEHGRNQISDTAMRIDSRFPEIKRKRRSRGRRVPPERQFRVAFNQRSTLFIIDPGESGVWSSQEYSDTFGRNYLAQDEEQWRTKVIMAALNKFRISEQAMLYLIIIAACVTHKYSGNNQIISDGES